MSIPIEVQELIIKTNREEKEAKRLKLLILNVEKKEQEAYALKLSDLLAENVKQNALMSEHNITNPGPSIENKINEVRYKIDHINDILKRVERDVNIDYDEDYTDEMEYVVGQIQRPLPRIKHMGKKCRAFRPYIVDPSLDFIDVERFKINARLALINMFLFKNKGIIIKLAKASPKNKSFSVFKGNPFEEINITKNIIMQLIRNEAHILHSARAIQHILKKSIGNVKKEKYWANVFGFNIKITLADTKLIGVLLNFRGISGNDKFNRINEEMGLFDRQKCLKKHLNLRNFGSASNLEINSLYNDIRMLDKILVKDGVNGIRGLQSEILIC